MTRVGSGSVASCSGGGVIARRRRLAAIVLIVATTVIGPGCSHGPYGDADSSELARKLEMFMTAAGENGLRPEERGSAELDMQLATGPDGGTAAIPASRIGKKGATHADFMPPPPPVKPAPQAPPRQEKRKVAMISPIALVGQDPEEITRFLGPPSKINQVYAATIWTYRTSFCVLDLYFYLNLGSQRSHVLTYDLAPAPGDIGPVDPATCFGAIMERSRNWRTG